MKRGLLLAAIFCMISAIFFAYFSYWEYRPVMLAESKKQILNQTVIKQEYEQKNRKEDEALFIEEEKKEENGSLEYEKQNIDVPFNRSIDFELLNHINRDIVGWIYIPGTSIDYPILIGDTNETYLDKDFERKKSVLGSIFSYADTTKNLSDARTILFGHNMKSYQMFGELKEYLDGDFRRGHTQIFVYTQTKIMELCIFSIFVCDENDAILWDDVELGSLEYQELLKEIEKRNVYDDLCVSGLLEMYNSQSFSLVTCSGNQGTSKRLVITGIVLDEQYIVN